MKILFFLPLALLISCVEINKDGAEVRLGANSKIRNGIKLEEHGLKVEQAFLLFEDNTLVPEGNVTTVNRKILCRLIIKGWTEKDGKIHIGASEKIETNDGNVFLDEKDLFESQEAVNPEDAEYITLSAVITGVDKLYDYFLVTFKVWDKTSNKSVDGSFQFKVQ